MHFKSYILSALQGRLRAPSSFQGTSQLDLMKLETRLTIPIASYTFHDVTLPSQRKNWSIMPSGCRAQLQVITFITSVKETLFYN